MNKQDMIKYLQLSDKIEKIQKNNPLSLAKLWTPICHRWDGLGSKSTRARGCGRYMDYLDNDIWICTHCNIRESRSSQWGAIRSITSEAYGIFGGNRSGKTESVVMFAIATALGAKDPSVRDWLDINGLPPNFIQDDPAEVWISALSYGDALTYLRPKIEKFAPSNTQYIRWKAQDRASAIFHNGGKILSLSAESGREKFQGGAVKLVVLDEEHPKDIFDECMLRCVDHKGRVLLSMTALKGITWVHDVFISKITRGYGYSYISGLDNPYVSSVKLRRSISHMSDESQRSRLFGEFVNQQGLVYSEFSINIHVVPSFEPPADWARDRAIDFGVKNPFCCLYFAHDEKDDVLHVYREYYMTEKTTLDNGRNLEQIQKRYREEYRWTVADPESKDGRLTLMRECNIDNKPAPKHLGVVETINYVKERLAIDAEGKTHLLIHDNCKNLLKELRLYRWAEGAGGDRPIKKDDHALDALRYEIAFLKRWQLHQ